MIISFSSHEFAQLLYSRKGANTASSVIRVLAAGVAVAGRVPRTMELCSWLCFGWRLGCAFIQLDSLLGVVGLVLVVI